MHASYRGKLNCYLLSIHYTTEAKSDKLLYFFIIWTIFWFVVCSYVLRFMFEISKPDRQHWLPVCSSNFLTRCDWIFVNFIAKCIVEISSGPSKTRTKYIPRYSYRLYSCAIQTMFEVNRSLQIYERVGIKLNFLIHKTLRSFCDLY